MSKALERQPEVRNRRALSRPGADEQVQRAYDGGCIREEVASRCIPVRTLTSVSTQLCSVACRGSSL